MFSGQIKGGTVERKSVTPGVEAAVAGDAVPV